MGKCGWVYWATHNPGAPFIFEVRASVLHGIHVMREALSGCETMTEVSSDKVVKTTSKFPMTASGMSYRLSVSVKFEDEGLMGTINAHDS